MKHTFSEAQFYKLKSQILEILMQENNIRNALQELETKRLEAFTSLGLDVKKQYSMNESDLSVTEQVAEPANSAVE